MGKRLVDKYDSKYRENNKNLVSSQAREAIKVYVENEDDVSFWKIVFNSFNLNTHVIPASKNKENEESLNRGKKTVLNLKSNIGPQLILCVDSDYDYLLQNATEISSLINNSEFIFQTYSYSTENLRCYAPSWNDLLLKSTLVDDNSFDSIKFMTEYSEIIYPLFLYSFAYELNKFKGFTIKSFSNTIQLNTKFNAIKYQNELKRLKKNVSKQLEQLPVLNNLDEIKNQLSELGVEPTNVYLFIQGHGLMNTVVSCVLVSLHTHRNKQKIKEINNFKRDNISTKYTKTHKYIIFILGCNTKIIKWFKKIFRITYKQTVSDKEITDRQQQHKNQLADIKTLLLTNDCFKSCPLYKKIETDIQSYITKYKFLN